MRTIVCLTLLLGMLASAALANSPATSPLTAAAWKSFVDRAGRDWQVVWSPARGVPRVIRGATPLRIGDGTTAQGRSAAASAFLASHGSLYGLRPELDSFVQTTELSRGRMHFLKFEQRHRGLRVRSGGLSLAMGEDGGLRMVTGEAIPGLDLDITPSAEAVTAADQLAARFTGPTAVLVPSHTLEILEIGGRPTLCLVVAGRDADGMLVEYAVDAQRGNVAEVITHSVHATGSGYVFPTNGFDAYVTASLPRLDGTGTILKGQNADITHNGNISGRATDPNAQYFYTPTLPPANEVSRFDEVNTYYHMDRFIGDFLRTQLGLTGIPNAPIVRVNWFGSVTSDDPLNDQTYINLTGNQSVIRDNAKDADLIYHEATHAVLYSLGIGRPSLFGTETGPFHEGMATYFACALTNSPRWGEYSYVNFPAGIDTLTTSPAIYNYKNWGKSLLVMNGMPLYPYGNAGIWSGALWDLRTALGGSIADRLALECVYYLNGNPDYVQAAYGYLQADVDVYGSAHVSTIVSKFAARGIPVGLLNVNLTGPVELNPNQWGTFNSNRTGGIKPFTYVWEQFEHCSCVQPTDCEYWFTLSGNTPTIQARSETDFSIRVTVTDSLGLTRTDVMGVTGRYTCDGGGGGGEFDPAVSRPLPLQVTPNPASSLVSISFATSRPGPLRAEVFDLVGRRVATLVDGIQEAGPKTYLWTVADMKKGMYVVRVTHSGRVEKARVMLLPDGR